MFDGTEIESAQLTALDVREHLTRLRAERALASLEGTASDDAYLSELDDEIAATYEAYVGAAVTDIATLRAEMSGRQVG